MATSVTLPELGESVTEGTVTRWLKAVGDEVAVDEPLLEISTDKVDTEIPSPVAGTLLEIKAEEDETVEIGAELAVIGESGESTGGDGGGESEEAPAEESKAEEEPEPEKEPEPEPEAKAEPESEPEPEAKAEPESEPEPEAKAEPESEPAAEQEPHLDTKQTGEGTAVVLPELGESVTEGTVTRWLKAVGDDVAVDEPLLEISTDKVDTEIPSPVAGTLLEIKADEDETVEIGAELAIIGEAGSAPAEKEPEPEAKRRARARTRARKGTGAGGEGRTRSREGAGTGEEGAGARAGLELTEAAGAGEGLHSPARTQLPRLRHVRRRHPERRRHVRHPDRAQAGQAAQRRPRGRHRHRRRRPHPQAGRPRRRREGTGGQRRRRRRQPQLLSRRRCAARPRS